MIQDGDLQPYLSGQRLYGDDFSPEDIRRWYEDEKEAYTELYVRRDDFHYEFRALDIYHSFRHVQKWKIEHALGVGSATGDEFLPVLDRIARITILEPSDIYRTWNNVSGVPAVWVVPAVSGDIALESGTVDLITCFGVLHHIPNVSHVVKECARVLSRGGMMLVREPVISMGDWTRVRPGLTKRERGIPLPLFQRMFAEAGLRVMRRSACVFPVMDVLWRRLRKERPYNNMLLTRVDALLSACFSWNYRYHRTSLLHKLAPRDRCFVLVRDDASG